MPELARRQYDRDLYRVNHYGSNYSVNSSYGYNRRNSQNNGESVHVVRNHSTRTANSQKIARNNLIHKIVSVAVISVLGLTILPVGFNKITKSNYQPHSP